MEDSFADKVSNEIIAAIAENGSEREEEEQEMDIEDAIKGDGTCGIADNGQGSEGTSGEEEGIAWEEGGEDESSFREDNEEEDSVSQGTIVAHDFNKVFIEVNEQIDKVFDNIQDLIQ